MYSTYIVQLHAILPHLPTPEMDKQYQRHCDIRNKARRVLQLQNNIRAFKTIPKQYSPQSYLQLVQPTPTLTQEFHEKYKELFFEHAITLEMEQARLRQIVSYTEEQLAKSTEPDATDITDILLPAITLKNTKYAQIYFNISQAHQKPHKLLWMQPLNISCNKSTQPNQ